MRCAAAWICSGVWATERAARAAASIDGARGHIAARRAALAVLGTILAGSAPARGQCQYEVTQLDYPYTCSISVVITNGSGLSNNGAVVGSWQCATWKHTEAFLWTPEDGFTTLPRPPGVYSAAASDISDDGVIVGTYSTLDSMSVAFLYQNGQYTELPPLPGGLWSWANAISDDGSIVVGGRSIGPGINPYNAFVFSAETGFTDLGVMNGPYSSANGIGPEGQVVGWTGSISGISHAFLWQDGQFTVLPPVPGGTTSAARAVLASSTVLGSGAGPAPPGAVTPMVGFLWRDGQFTLIDPVPGYDTSGTGGINGAFQVTGLSARLSDTDDRRGYLCQHGVTRNLNDLVPPGTPVIDQAGAINEQGQILAAAGIHCVLLTPVGRPLGDLDIDCKVGITDFLRLLADWGQAGSAADLNGDGTVNQSDFTILLKNWSGA